MNNREVENIRTLSDRARARSSGYALTNDWRREQDWRDASDMLRKAALALELALAGEGK